MKTRKMAALGAILLVIQLSFAQAALADASYQSTTQITGGSLVDTMKQMSFMKSVKDLLAPISTQTMVHGNQKAEVSKDYTTITDLDKGEIIRVDHLKKTYTVTTFAQMRQAFANMPKQMDEMQAKMKQAQAQQSAQAPVEPSNIKTSFDVAVKNTGVSKLVNGQMAQEQVITMTMKVTMIGPPPATPGAPPPPVDPNAPTEMTYTVTTDTWVAPDPPEVKEIQEFDVRMGQKLMQGVDMKQFAGQMKQMQSSGNAAMAQLLGGKPGATDAMKQMGEEMAKLKGTRVLEVTSMGGLAPAGSVPAAGTTSAPPPTAGSVAGQVATDTATQTAAGESGKMGVFGNALSNSAFKAFGRKKSTPPPPSPPPPAAATGGAPAMQTVVLMATTTQKDNFTHDPVPVSAFQIPAGYKKVESPYQQMAK